MRSSPQLTFPTHGGVEDKGADAGSKGEAQQQAVHADIADYASRDSMSYPVIFMGPSISGGVEAARTLASCGRQRRGSVGEG